MKNFKNRNDTNNIHITFSQILNLLLSFYPISLLFACFPPPRIFSKLLEDVTYIMNLHPPYSLWISISPKNRVILL